MRHQNNTFTRLKPVALALGLAAASAAGLSAQVRYQIVFPEAPGASATSHAQRGNEINDNGEILINRISSFAVWKDGAATLLVNARTDHPGSLSRLDAASLNRHQQAVGTKTYRLQTESGERFVTFPFYWDASNGLLDLDDLGERSATTGEGVTTLTQINNRGVAIGASRRYDASGSGAGNQAFLWSFDTGRVDIAPLADLDGVSETTPLALNDLDVAVGLYRDFIGSTDVYLEKGFVYLPESGSQDLKELDSDFFGTEQYTARDISNAGYIVGERERQAYLYHLGSGEGVAIYNPIAVADGTRAYAVNDNAVVAGAAEARRPNGALSSRPMLWTPETGSLDLLPHFESQLARELPESLAADAVRVTPKAINNRGQISVRVEADASTGSSFAREAILQPSLDFRWSSSQQVIENGVRGVLYVHRKDQLDGAIPAAALGLDIAFECSSDMKNWRALDLENGAARVSETEDRIELFVPFADCIFVRPVLADDVSAR